MCLRRVWTGDDVAKISPSTGACGGVLEGCGVHGPKLVVRASGCDLRRLQFHAGCGFVPGPVCGTRGRQKYIIWWYVIASCDCAKQHFDGHLLPSRTVYHGIFTTLIDYVSGMLVCSIH